MPTVAVWHYPPKWPSEESHQIAPPFVRRCLLQYYPNASWCPTLELWRKGAHMAAGTCFLFMDTNTQLRSWHQDSLVMVMCLLGGAKWKQLLFHLSHQFGSFFWASCVPSFICSRCSSVITYTEWMVKICKTRGDLATASHFVVHLTRQCAV